MTRKRFPKDSVVGLFEKTDYELSECWFFQSSLDRSGEDFSEQT